MVLVFLEVAAEAVLEFRSAEDDDIFTKGSLLDNTLVLAVLSKCGRSQGS